MRDGRAKPAERLLRPVAPPAVGMAFGGAIALVLLVIAGVALERVAHQPPTVASLLGGAGALLLLGAASFFTYWAHACSSMRYSIQDGALVVECGAIRQVVPLHLIKDVRKGYTADPGGIRGLSWPGFHVGWANVEGMGVVRFYSTHRHHDQLVYLVLDSGAFAVSVKEDQIRQEIAHAGATRLQKPQVFCWPLLNAAVWADRRLFLVMAIALGLNVVMLIYAFAQFPGLPELMPVHFTPFGTVDRIGYRSEVLRVPFFALALWAIDSTLALALYGLERLAAYLCVATGLVVQICFLLAVLRIFSI